MIYHRNAIKNNQHRMSTLSETKVNFLRMSKVTKRWQQTMTMMMTILRTIILTSPVKKIRNKAVRMLRKKQPLKITRISTTMTMKKTKKISTR